MRLHHRQFVHLNDRLSFASSDNPTGRYSVDGYGDIHRQPDQFDRSPRKASLILWLISDILWRVVTNEEELRAKRINPKTTNISR